MASSVVSSAHQPAVRSSNDFGWSGSLSVIAYFSLFATTIIVVVAGVTGVVPHRINLIWLVSASVSLIALLAQTVGRKREGNSVEALDVMIATGVILFCAGQACMNML